MKKIHTALLCSLAFTCAAFQPVKAQLNHHPANVPYYHATAEKVNDLVDTKLDVKFDYQRSHLWRK